MFKNSSVGDVVRMEFDAGDGSEIQVFEGVKSVSHTYSEGKYHPVIRLFNVDELELPASEWTPDSPIVVKATLPPWVAHLKWAIPSMLGMLLVGFVGTRRIVSAAEQRRRMLLSGVLNVSRKSKRPAWKPYEFAGVSDCEQVDLEDSYQITVESVVDDSTGLIQRRVDLLKADAPIATEYIEDDLQYSLGDFLIRYTD